MQSQQDQLNRYFQESEHVYINQYSYQSSLSKQSFMSMNIQSKQVLQMSKNVKYINEKYDLQDIYQASQQDVGHFMKSNKHFFGIKYLFGLQGQKTQDFLQDIDSEIFNTSFYDNPNLVDLNKLFENNDAQSQKFQHKKLIDQLTKKLGEIQNKAFTGISIHKTIGSAFYDHFENFMSLRNSSVFLQNFYISFQKFFQDLKRLKKNGMNTILMIYQFWMRMFRQFVRQIWRHSQKYSLDLFKKDKNKQTNKFEFNSNKSSTSSSQQGEKIQKQRRKPWSTHEIQVLQKIIASNAVFNHTRLQRLADQFERSFSSISCKIQKIMKLKKLNVEKQFQEEVSTQKKVQSILKLNSQGLSKDQVIKKICQLYQMGQQQNWKKSVCQILSSKKNIIKQKGTFLLINYQQYSGYNLSQTLKQKIIKCLLQFQNCQADLKNISFKYVQLFGHLQGILTNDRQKIKIIQTNISKALNRYDIFHRTNEKIIYKLDDKSQHKSNQMDLQDYID